MLNKLPPGQALLTPHVYLRRLKETDADMYYRAITESRAALEPWAPWLHPFPTHEDIWRYCMRSSLFWDEGQTYRFIGLTHDKTAFRVFVELAYHANAPSFELGYWCHTAHTGQGLMTEALTAVMDAAFSQLEAQRVFYRTNPQNIKSAKMAERLDFTHEGTLKNYERNGEGQLEDMHFFAHRPESWLTFKNKA